MPICSVLAPPRRLGRARFLLVDAGRLVVAVAIVLLAILAHGIVLPPRRVRRRRHVQVVQLALVEVAGLEVAAAVAGGALVAEALEPGAGARAQLRDDGQALVTGGAAARAPDVVAPDGGADGDDGEHDLARLLVGGPLGVAELLVLLGLVRVGVVGGAADGGVGQLLAVEEGLRGGPADLADVDADEAVQHVARAPRVVEGHHVRRVVEEHVRQVARLLPEARVLALEGPVAPRGPVAGRQLEALAAVPLHVADEGLCAQVVADQVLGAREQEHVDLLENVGQQVDGRLRVPGAESVADGAVTLGPPRHLVLVDVQRFSHLLLPEVGRHGRQVRGPVHAAARVYVLQADVVHVDAFLLTVGTLGLGQTKNLLQYMLAGIVVYMVACCS